MRFPHERSLSRHTPDRFLATIFAVAILACAPSEEGPTEADLEALRGELLQVDADFATATADAGVEGWLEYFDEDGLMLSGDRVTRGHVAIREVMEPFLEDNSTIFQWFPDESGVSAGGHLGWTTGTYRVAIRDEDGTEDDIERGRYLTVWRRQVDGSWKVAVDIGNEATEE